MPFTTMLREEEINQETSDRELNELLASVRAVTGDNWQLVERTYKSKPLFRKERVRRYYSLFKEVGGYLPYQWFGFRNGYEVAAAEIAAFFYGVLAGAKRAAKASGGERA